MLLAPCSAKLSAQSPPCSRKASPAATRASAFLRLRASPAKTSGGKVASCCSTSASAFRSGDSGTWRIGFFRQLSGVQRSGTAQLLISAQNARKPPPPGLYTTDPRRGYCFSAGTGMPRSFRGFPHVGRGPLTHGDELLGSGRMQRHGGIEVGLGRPHLHRNADELDHLGSALADEVAADDPVGAAVDH